VHEENEWDHDVVSGDPQKQVFYEQNESDLLRPMSKKNLHVALSDYKNSLVEEILLTEKLQSDILPSHHRLYDDAKKRNLRIGKQSDPDHHFNKGGLSR